MNKQIYKLCRQYWRLDARASPLDKSRIDWGLLFGIFDVLDELESLGLDPVTSPYLDKETPEGKSILETL